MIDKSSRIIASEILEKLKVGELTNWELEDQWPESKTDASLNCVLRWLWTQYNDDNEGKLIDLMSDENKAVLENCISFFKTDIEFSIKQISEEEKLKIKKEWGKEWRADCSTPQENANWPFPET